MNVGTKLTDAEHEILAERLYRAVHAGVGIDPPSESIEYSFEDAYRIRRKLVDRLIADGGRPRGHKIGFTSEVMQKMYGMSGPDFGILLDRMFVQAGAPVRVSHMSNTRAEPELAFELARSLSGPGVTIQDALDATARVFAAIEVIDSRVGAMRAKANDSLADNAGAGCAPCRKSRAGLRSFLSGSGTAGARPMRKPARRSGSRLDRACV